MKSKKTLAIVLAIMMILSSFPIISLAAEAPTITTWPSLEKTTIEVGQSYADAGVVGGSASVPGTFSHYSTIAAVVPRSGYTPYALFTPDDTETYSTARGKFTTSLDIVSCSCPKLDGELKATVILAGTALSTSTISLADGAKILAYATDITARVDTITFDNPDKVYTELGTYEEPVTIKFKLYRGTAYAVDLKTTVKVTVSDKIDAVITTAPTAASIGVGENTTAKELVLTGGVANVDGTFTVTNPDQKLVAGDNTVNVTFTPADTSKYNPATVDIAVTCKAKINVPENIVVTAPWTGGSMMLYRVSVNPADIGITQENVKGSFDTTQNADRFMKLVPGEYDVYVMFYGTGYASETVPAKLKVIPGVTTSQLVKSGTDSVAQEDGSYLLNITLGSIYEAPQLNGKMVAYVNGEKIAELPVSKTSQKVEYRVTESGNYKVTVGYIGAEGDYYISENPVWDSLGGQDLNFEVVMPRSITTKNCILTTDSTLDNGKYTVGQEIQIRAEDFATDKYHVTAWTFTDSDGNEIVPEGLMEGYMTNRSVTFKMPNTDLTVEATIEKLPEPEPDPEQPGDNTGIDSGLGDILDNIELPDIDLELPELELDTEGDHKFNFVNIIQNLIEMLKNFIKQIGQTIEGIL